MQAFLNIEKSAFHRQEYIGYGRGNKWSIRRLLCGPNKWVAISRDRDLIHIYGSTLEDISKQLEG